jgi:DMSO/TMAO reductase YedYZ molybdopterin-dependent catalytic subunit
MKVSFKITTLIMLLIVSAFTTATTVTAKASTSNEWQLNINGLVQHPLTLTIDDLKAMPQTTEEATIFCVDFPSQIVTTGIWTGVTLATLLDQAGVQPTAVKVAFSAADQYATDLDIASARQSGVMVAYAKDGTSLSENLRLVVPGKWGYKWISQLTTITLVDYDFRGKWESQGYSDTADMQSTGGTSGVPSSQNVPIFGNPTQTNATIAPSSKPPSSNTSATAVPPQITEEPQPEIKPQTPNTTLGVLEIAGAVTAVVVCASSMAYILRRRRLKTQS